MGFFGMVIKAGEKEKVVVPPGWCLQLCSAAFEPPKGTKVQVPSASLWLQVEGEIGDTSFLIGTLQGGGSCAQIEVRHCLTSVDGEVVVEAKGNGSIHLTGFFDREFNDGEDSEEADEEEQEEEEDSDEMPSLDTLAMLKRGMRQMHKRRQGEDDDDDDSDESEDDGEGEEEEDEGEQIPALRKGPGPKRSAALAAIQAFPTSKATGNRQGKGGDPEEDSEEDDDDYVPGEGSGSDDGMEEEGEDGEEQEDDDGEDSEEQEGDDGDSGEDDGDEKEAGAGGKNGKPMGIKRGPSDGSAQASRAPAVKRSRTEGGEDKEEAGERSKAAEDGLEEEEEERKLTKQERKSLRKKENKRKAAEAKRELEEAFSTLKNDDKEPPVGVPLKSPRTKTLKGGLKIKDTVLGGGKVAVIGKNVKVCYEGCFPDGRVFDKKLSRKRPLQFRLGMKQVIVGMDKGVEGMRVGGSREIAIPSALGYGARGTGPIPANQDLMFRVELIDVLGK